METDFQITIEKEKYITTGSVWLERDEKLSRGIYPLAK
jgi:hypothetical protein